MQTVLFSKTLKTN